MVKIGDRVQIYETCSNYYGRCGIVIGDDFCPTFPYKVEFEDGDDCIFKGKDLIVLSAEKERTMLFEVGDEVRVRQPTNLFHSELGKVVSIDHVKLMYKVIFHRGNSDVYACFDLILVKRQEEKVMTFKVGDKVKVKDSWFGFTGEVGLIVRIDGPAKYPYRVKFDVVDEEDEELFAEGSLELVKEKQSFTKSDLKTGMGVVLRNGDKAHVLLGTDYGDVMRFLEKDTWDTLDSANEDLTWKGMDNFDIVEVYSTKLASRYLTDMVFEAKCVFKREEPKSEPKPEPEPTKMTMKEINEHFGKPIEIVE